MDDGAGTPTTFAGGTGHRDGIPALAGMTGSRATGFAECRHPAEGREPWTRASVRRPRSQESPVIAAGFDVRRVRR